MKTHKDCTRYEDLLKGAEHEILSDANIAFMLQHHRDCTGIHSDAAIEQMNCLAPGTLETWNGRDPLPRSPELLERLGQKLAELADEPDGTVESSSIDPAGRFFGAPYLVIPHHTSLSRSENPMLEDRRGFLHKLACFLGAPAVAAAAEKRNTPTAFATRDIADGGTEVSSLKKNLDRVDMLSSLFKPKGFVACFAGDSRLLQRDNVTKWDAWKGHGFLNCRIPIGRYTNLFPLASEITDSDKELNVADQENVLSTGSPHASAIAREYLPYWDERRDTFSRGVFANPAAIPFHFTIRKEEGWCVSPSVGGPNHEELKSLRVGAKVYSVGNEPDEPLKSDFLLVTRLPKIGGGYIILIAGGHGAGTRSFELLFDRRAFPDSQLRYLYSRIGGEECFQVAFKCSALEHGDESTVARKLEVWDDLAAEIDPKSLVVSEDGP